MLGNGLTFHSQWAFLLLIAVPIAALGIFWLQRRRTGTFVYGNTHALREVKTGLLGHLHALPGILRVLALVALVVAIARPQKPNRKVIASEGVDILVALDMSASMNAVDNSPEEIRAAQLEGKNPKNRFQVATELLVDFIKNRAEAGDRVGLVIFGEGAYLKYPLTSDYRRAIKDITELVLDDGIRDADSPEFCRNDCTISGGATAIGDALRRGFLRLRDASGKEKTLILITDGAEKGSKMSAKYVAEYVRDWGRELDPETKQPRKPIKIYPFLVGGGSNVYVPDTSNRTGAIVRDRSGLIRYQAVPPGAFETNPALLQEIATLTGGKYFQGYDEKAFREQFKDFEKTVYERTIEDFPDEKFMPWAYLALALVLLEALLRLTVLRKFP